MKKKRNKTLAYSPVEDERMVYYCDKVIEWGLYALVFLVPLVYTRWVTSLSINKLTLAMLLTFVLFSIWVFRITQKKTLGVLNCYLCLPIFFFLLTCILSVLNSRSILLSIYGGYGENQGMFTIIMYILLFLMIANVIQKQNVKKLVFFLLLGGAMVALYGIFQHTGVDPLFREASISSRERSYSTIGNPIFLGGYLVLLVPISIGLLMSQVSMLGKVLSILATILMYICLLFTYSRGAWLGFVAPILVLAYFYGIYNIKAVKENRYWLMSLLVILFFLTVMINGQKIRDGNNTISLSDRILSVKDFHKGAAGARLDIWKSTLQMIRDYPFWGIGLDAFRVIFVRYQSPQLAKFEGDFTTATKAHNKFLQVAATTGFWGVFAYLWVLIAFLGKGLFHLRVCKDRELWNQTIGIYGAMIAYLIQAQFVFDDITTGLMFWVLLGMSGVIWKTPSKDKATSLSSPMRAPALYRRFAVLLSSTIFFIGMSIAGSIFISDVYYYQATKSFHKGEECSELHALEKAVKLNPTVGEYHHYLGYCYGQNGRWQEAERELMIATKLIPYYVDTYYLLGGLYERFGQTDKAIKTYEIAEKVINVVSPHDLEIYLRLWNVYERKGMHAKAKAALRKAQR